MHEILFKTSRVCASMTAVGEQIASIPLENQVGFHLLVIWHKAKMGALDEQKVHMHDKSKAKDS